MDDDVYQSRQDPAITVGSRFPGGPFLRVRLPGLDDHPWTLPSNQAVAVVNPDVTYVDVAAPDGHRYVLAEAGWPPTPASWARSPRSRHLHRSADLLGRHALSAAVPVLHRGRPARNAFQVLRGEFVTTEDGTGIVHMAPAYGEDDKATTDTGASCRPRQWTPRAGSTRRCPTTRASRCSTPTRRSSAT